MTARTLVKLARELEEAANQAVSWMSPGGYCCEPPTRAHGYCTNPACAARHETYSAMWAARAASLANRIQRALRKPMPAETPTKGDE